MKSKTAAGEGGRRNTEERGRDEKPDWKGGRETGRREERQEGRKEGGKDRKHPSLPAHLGQPGQEERRGGVARDGDKNWYTVTMNQAGGVSAGRVLGPALDFSHFITAVRPSPPSEHLLPRVLLLLLYYESPSRPSPPCILIFEPYLISPHLRPLILWRHIPELSSSLPPHCIKNQCSFFLSIYLSL